MRSLLFAMFPVRFSLNKGTFWTFSLTFGAIFRGVQSGIFGLENAFWGFGVPGLCSKSERLQLEERLWL